MAGDDEHPHHPRHALDYVRGFFSNWSTAEGSIAQKVARTFRNRARAWAPPFPNCCGHPGEPGC